MKWLPLQQSQVYDVDDEDELRPDWVGALQRVIVWWARNAVSEYLILAADLSNDKYIWQPWLKTAEAKYSWSMSATGQIDSTEVWSVRKAVRVSSTWAASAFSSSRQMFACSVMSSSRASFKNMSRSRWVLIFRVSTVGSAICEVVSDDLFARVLSSEESNGSMLQAPGAQKYCGGLGWRWCDAMSVAKSNEREQWALRNSHVRDKQESQKCIECKRCRCERILTYGLTTTRTMRREVSATKQFELRTTSYVHKSIHTMDDTNTKWQQRERVWVTSVTNAQYMIAMSIATANCSNAMSIVSVNCSEWVSRARTVATRWILRA